MRGTVEPDPDSYSTGPPMPQRSEKHVDRGCESQDRPMSTCCQVKRERDPVRPVAFSVKRHGGGLESSGEAADEEDAVGMDPDELP